MADPLTELQELEKAATPGPWRVDYETGVGWSIRGDVAIRGSFGLGDFARLVVHMRNALPDMLHVVEAARKVAANQAQDVDPRLDYVIVQPDRNEWQELLTALARLDVLEQAGDPDPASPVAQRARETGDGPWGGPGGARLAAAPAERVDP